ncbi:MAG: tRNA (N(6)-L-threonylcarbamoyladenosine(37)-C(2))-methylthiotransferase MtaB [Rickettsiales bacterium]|nr:tRNA (N(6)-L-threonylcarbamoyladenosine(37)-C(2))-methylthiotransferase MtaB [Rickettsiales bacterium]|tara:strand:+ start:521 stop:1738 length:1218 start_codon:yes stop_codon:yes gene_type:complete
MSIEIHTLGCRLNVYESEVMRAHAQAAGMENTIIINSCAVTKEAERQTRQQIRRSRRDHPEARIIVTGCSAQIHPDTYAAMPEVDQVLGNEEKLNAESWSSPQTERIRVNDIMSINETAAHFVSHFDGQTRAFVQVQNGCNHRCTFCIIPYGRGNSRSVPVAQVVSEIRKLTESGYKEVVLTGVDISAYGEDLPGEPSLGSLCRRILSLVPDLPRLRLSSIDVAEIDDDLRALIAEEPRFMPHLHISLQAGDDMILKRMKRRHTRQQVIDFCLEARQLRPDMVFGADIIAGFPTETDAMFANTLHLVEEAGLTYLHVFPYSEREGTPAARMPQVAPSLRKDRAAQLRAAGKAAELSLYGACVGKQVQLLMEKDGIGRSEQFVPVKYSAAAGELAQVIITQEMVAQ